LLASKLYRLGAKLYIQQFCCGDLKRWLMTKGFKTNILLEFMTLTCL
jgi:hypothetical protein